MVERTTTTITVRPSSAHPDVLDVKDAMQQVIDFFEFLTGDDDGESVIWNLVRATTNTPFTVAGEAVSRLPDVDVSVMVRASKAAAKQEWAALAAGRRPSGTLSQRRETLAKRLLNRNVNGVGATEVIFDADEPALIMTVSAAKQAMRMLESPVASRFELLPQEQKGDEIGSVEGRLVDVSTDYNKPAIRIQERVTGSVFWCRVDESTREKIAGQATFNDVWDHRRVLVRGRVAYDSDGNISRVYASSVELIQPRSMTIDDIRDEDFTEGLDTAEYLEKLREGDFGD